MEIQYINHVKQEDLNRLLKLTEHYVILQRNNLQRLCTKYKVNDLPKCVTNLDIPPRSNVKPHKSRRPKKTNNSNIDLNQIDLSLYIKTTIICINNREFLIDEHNIIYEYNDNNMIVGRKLPNDQVEWF